MTDRGSKLGIRRLESKRTFVAGRLTGTAVWDPRSLEREEGEIVCATVYDAPQAGLAAKVSSSFDILHIQLCYC